ncbi:MAG: Bifunctional protein GlmU [Acetothermia bacterium 64_32]|nr:MAG: Bifunctional protein GlmU [Acetothermia bacterium 64_32]HAF70038.1 UDP-N-acetylglucosamine diphosphorylase/glucosamine-1-phosphate N-acetyltransferase [Candidatus Acetothermia bacterium]
MKPLDVVILASGKDARMCSRIPKVLHPLAGLPLLEHVLRTALSLSPGAVVVVVGQGADQVRAAFQGRGLVFVDQGGPPNTAQGLLSARPAVQAGVFLLLPGDIPLLSGDALEALLRFHRERGLVLSFLSILTSGPARHGRVVRDGGVRIVEEGSSGALREASSGVYCLSNVPELWEALEDVLSESGEGRISALVERFPGRADGLVWGRPEELSGVDDRVDLARLEGLLRRRLLERLMLSGVTVVDPGAVYLSPDVEVGPDTVLYPGVHLYGRTGIGQGCAIGPGAYLIDSRIEEGVRVWYSVLEGAYVEKGARIGPFAHLRPGAHIGAGARVGNFVEVKAARLGEGVKAGHLAYIGDAEVGAGANIGAGTITCNYDGVRKHRTEIGPGAFIGSNAALVAPVRIGEGAYVGAGSVITQDVPPYALALGRSRQVIKPDWAKGRRKG